MNLRADPLIRLIWPDTLRSHKQTYTPVSEDSDTLNSVSDDSTTRNPVSDDCDAQDIDNDDCDTHNCLLVLAIAKEKLKESWRKAEGKVKER